MLPKFLNQVLASVRPLAGVALLFNLSSCATKPLPLEPLAASQRFAMEINSFTSADATNPPPRNPILFIGSSSIRLWKTLASDFPNHRVINRGFGGSQIFDSLNYVDRIVLPYRPRQIVMYAGANDINAGKTPEHVFEDYKAFVAKVHTRLPRTPIAFISISPNPARWAQIAQVREANSLIEDYTRQHAQLTFINAFPLMLGPDGQPRPDIFIADRLHMNERGYELWKTVVGPVLLP